MPRTKPINPRIKYYPPRLMERLEYIKNYPLTLVEAPSGFGKTTILEHFLDTRLPHSILRDGMSSCRSAPGIPGGNSAP